ncbi:hypothetical protein [uncultured Massilia sp.]|uniref:hypothetical protein n=1 Tax=uncultured Massilia sp. TaxID=169973 RepID=UPI00258BA737|nr:hypothetical protein [uncultured Massilia sp.]
MLDDTRLTITIADPAGAEAHACLTRYVEELQARFDRGFDPAASVSANPEELMPPSGYFLIARQDGVAAKKPPGAYHGGFSTSIYREGMRISASRPPPLRPDAGCRPACPARR